MATIGLDKLYYASITEDDYENETYGTPTQLAKAISAELSVELAEATLYADDGASEIVKEFKEGTLTLGVDDIGADAAAALTGVNIDDNGVIISSSEDGGDPVAIGFRAKKANGKYRYFWLYRVKFGIPSTSLETKGDSITFQTPSIEGTVLRRNKEDANGNHPWKAEVTEGASGVSDDTISSWYNEVYEPVFEETVEELSITATASATEITLSESITVTSSASGGTGSYTYSFLYKKESTSSYTTAQSYGSSNTYTFTFEEAATYIIAAKVKDSDGTIVTQYITVTVIED